MTSDFKKIIDNDRDTRVKNSWKGTMLEYMELIRANPDIAKLAHKRLHDMIVGPGVTEINLEENPRLQRIFKGEKVKTFKYFEEDFYGMLGEEGKSYEFKDQIRFFFRDPIFASHFTDGRLLNGD